LTGKFRIRNFAEDMIWKSGIKYFYSINILNQMKYLIFFVFLLPVCSKAQPRFSESKPRKNIYVEVGGNGLAFNVVYETRVNKSADGFGIKIGAGGYSSSYENIFSVPLSGNWLISKDNKNYFELGFGATFLHYDDKAGYFYPSYPEYPPDVIGLKINNRNSVYGHLALGYRHQPSKGGITWGVAITPHFNNNGFWPIWGGIKFGYSLAANTKQ